MLYLVRIALERYLPHLCTNEKYMAVQAFIVVSWLLFSPGFWDNLIGSIFSYVSPAWEYVLFSFIILFYLFPYLLETFHFSILLLTLPLD